jgi:hypothetical protein
VSAQIKVTVKHGDAAEEPNAETTGRSGSSIWPWLFLTVVLLALAVLAFVFKDTLINGRESNAGKNVEPSYQAVFLANGQVYFGRLSEPNSQYVTLKDIYYLQVVQQQLQGQQYSQQTGQAPQISLVKLGNELHGPEDEMKISRSQILFYEDLKPDSQVVKAIKDYQSKPQIPSPQPQQPPATPSNQ